MILYTVVKKHYKVITIQTLCYSNGSRVDVIVQTFAIKKLYTIVFKQKRKTSWNQSIAIKSFITWFLYVFLVCVVLL